MTESQLVARMRIRGLVTLGLVAAFWLVDNAQAQGQPSVVPVFPADLIEDAEKAPAEVAKLLRALSRPADELTLADGSTVLIRPTADFLRPGTPGGMTLQPIDGSGVTAGSLEIAAVRFYEERTLAAVKELIGKADAGGSGFALAEKLLRAALRFHLAERNVPAEGENPWRSLGNRLSEELLDTRRRLLRSPEGARWANQWLPLLGADDPPRAEIRTSWVERGQAHVTTADWAHARELLDRLEGEFPRSTQAEPLRLALRGRADALFKESASLPDAQALSRLRDAFALWPRLPGLRDELEKRQGRYKIVYVAVPALPEFLSPAMATSEIEKQTLPLLFEKLVERHQHPITGRTYRPRLAERLPDGTGLTRHLRLRASSFWSNGDGVTNADVRHTVQLLAQPELAGRTALWREFVEPPRLPGDPFALSFTFRQGLFDPLAPLDFHLLPQQYRGRPLARADDPEFAQAPVGSGPFLYHGRVDENGRVCAVFRANPNHAMKTGGNVREIRFVAWSDDKVPTTAPPQLVFAPAAGQRASLRKQGNWDLQALPNRRVALLGLNHRVPTLGNVHLRRALAHALDRRGILARDFSFGELPNAKAAATVNGPFPRGSWAAAAAPRVPDELFQPELAVSFAKKAKKEFGRLEWTLKIPAGDERLVRAADDMGAQLTKTFGEAGITVSLKVVSLPPQRLRAAIHQRDFDLVYHEVQDADDPFTLWSLFDPHPDATRAGGSNYAGYDNDATMQSLLRSALSHRQFRATQEAFQATHAHWYETMPLVPLWQVPTVVAVHSTLRTPPLEPLAIFADVLEWQVAP